MPARFPLVRSLGVRDPLAALRALSGLPHAFLPHSSLTDDRGRWSFFGADPFALHRAGSYDVAVSDWRALAARVRSEDPADPPAPFSGGVVGYWAYDFGRRLERLPAHSADDLGLPDFVLGFYDVVGACDHRSGEAWLFSSGLPLEGPSRREHAARRLDRFTRILDRAAPEPGRRVSIGGGESAGARLVSGPDGVSSTFSAGGYRRAVEKVKQHIRRGDIYQANLSRRWSVPLGVVDPGSFGLELLSTLATCSPAPFAAYFNAGDHEVASASPERFLELRGQRVEARPIKGTRPRGAGPIEDARLAAELLASVKDRAENVMIVDVLRNDMGRVCETGSIEVPSLCALETYPQVFHLTSTVTGVLRERLDAFDLLHACFPGGSITGAPKIRAIEILDGLEPVRRHLYTGSLGYVDWRGDADWNIAIRTALLTRRVLHFAAGGGITADSDPEAERLETLHKAEGIRRALSLTLGPVALEPEVRAVPA